MLTLGKQSGQGVGGGEGDLNFVPNTYLRVIYIPSTYLYLHKNGEKLKSSHDIMIMTCIRYRKVPNICKNCGCITALLCIALLIF